MEIGKLYYCDGIYNTYLIARYMGQAKHWYGMSPHCYLSCDEFKIIMSNNPKYEVGEITIIIPEAKWIEL